MNEFKFWVVIVTLLIFCIMALSFMVVHLEKRINKADVIIIRLEKEEKKREKNRIDPKSSDGDGM